MNRLDEALGPENWWDDYQPLEHSVICRLTVRLPDGQVLTKCDVGGCAGMADAGDDDKSGFSDAFKRAAVKFGPGRYLYRDGVATLVEPPVVLSGTTQASAPHPAQIPATATVRRGSPDQAPHPTVKSSSPAQAPTVREADDGQRTTDNGPPAKPTIKTGYQLYQWASKCQIDPRLTAWITSNFAKHPAKITNWSQDQVAAALPLIRKHLDEVKAGRQSDAA